MDDDVIILRRTGRPQALLTGNTCIPSQKRIGVMKVVYYVLYRENYIIITHPSSFVCLTLTNFNTENIKMTCFLLVSVTLMVIRNL